MISDVLKIINDEFNKLGIEYYFMVNTNPNVKYPYFTGEYDENTYTYSNDMYEGTLLLEGWHRGAYSKLIELTNTIIDHFKGFELTYDDLCICFSYGSHSYVRTDDIDLKKVMIYLKVVYWKGH